MIKKIICSALFSIFLVYANAQQQDSISTVGKNEIKANLLGIAIGNPEITYERILKQKKGIGIAAFVSPEKDSEYHFGFTPYFRWYLGKPKLLMFFVEGNMAAIYGEGYIYDKGGSSYSVKDVWGVGMGAAIGLKVVQRKSLILEGFLGRGKALGETRSFRVYERVGLTFGKRF